MKSGKKTKSAAAVCLVGAGPGDPGLITVKGMEALRSADVVIYDALANNSLLEFAPEKAEFIFAGKKKGFKALEQKEINALLIDRAGRGRKVIRLKGGDPFVFGRGGEEAGALIEAGIPVEIVPGVSSVHSVPAYSGVPLTHRDFNSSFAVVTGHKKPGKRSPVDWEALARMETVVFLMSAGNIGEIADKLMENKKPRKTPVMVTARGTTGRQKTVIGKLGDIADKVRAEGGGLAPAVVMTGGAVGMKNRFNWFEKKPLFGRKITVTRPAGQSADFINLLQQKGAEVFSFPCITIIPPASWKPVDRLADNLRSCDFLTFTSANGVERFFSRLDMRGLDARALGGAGTVCIGSKTAEALRRRGVRADIVPKKYTAEGVLEELKKSNVRGKTFFIPRADIARDALPEGLLKMGAKVETAACYRTRAPKYSKSELAAAQREVASSDAVVFTSSSSVTGFLGILKNGAEILRRVPVACIGPVTERTVRREGLTPSVVSGIHTTAGLADAMSDFFYEGE